MNLPGTNSIRKLEAYATWGPRAPRVARTLFASWKLTPLGGRELPVWRGRYSQAGSLRHLSAANCLCGVDAIRKLEVYATWGPRSARVAWTLFARWKLTPLGGRDLPVWRGRYSQAGSLRHLRAVSCPCVQLAHLLRFRIAKLPPTTFKEAVN